MPRCHLISVMGALSIFDEDIRQEELEGTQNVRVKQRSVEHLDAGVRAEPSEQTTPDPSSTATYLAPRRDDPLQPVVFGASPQDAALLRLWSRDAGAQALGEALGHGGAFTQHCPLPHPSPAGLGTLAMKRKMPLACWFQMTLEFSDILGFSSKKKKNQILFSKCFHVKFWVNCVN